MKNITVVGLMDISALVNKNWTRISYFLSRRYERLILPSASLASVSEIAGHLLPKVTNS